MRVLFLTIPGIGHAYPAVPLAWALRSAGHEVLFGTAGDGLAVERAGLPVIDLKLGEDQPEVFAEIEHRHPEAHARMRGDDGLHVHDLAETVGMFAELSTAFADPVVDLASAWRPDVVVHSAMHGAALMAAAKLGVPTVECREGFGRYAGLSALLYEQMTEAFAKYGASGLSERRTSTDSSPPSTVGGYDGWAMRYVPFNGGAVLPDWLVPPVDEPDRPRVGVTLGTISPTVNGLGPVTSVLAAAGDVDAEFVLALGNVDTEPLGPIPPNVRIVGWVPLSALLSTCTALIHHGGGGTTFTALDAGVTQLVFPGGGDDAINAAAVHKCGSGLWVRPDEVDGALLHRLVTDEGLRSAAAEVQAEMAAMPTPAEIVPKMVALAW
jgi:UDP:flavonoid glycosyltransferase YjiC (YdhE family)